MKKAISLVLALALCLSLGMPAFATDVTAKTQTVTTTDGTYVPLQGDVAAGKALISVVMPTSIPFAVSTTADATTNAKVFDSLVSGTGTFTNNSNCQVKLILTEVFDTDVLADANTTTPETAVGKFLTVVDLYLAKAGLSANEACVVENKLDPTDSTPINREMATLGQKGTHSLEIYGKDNTADQKSLIDGQYTINTIMKVEAVQ